MTKTDSARKTVMFIMLITVAGKALGLLREIKTGSLLGITGEAAAFNLAGALPRNLLDLAFASAISGCFIPVFNAERQKRGKQKAFKYANVFLSAAIVLSCVLTAVLMIFSRPLARLLMSGGSSQMQSLTAKLFLMTMPVIIISSCAYTLAALSQSLGGFFAPAAMSVFSNGIVILYCLFFFGAFGVAGLAAAFTLGWLPQLFILFPQLKRAGWRFRFTLDFSGEAIALTKKMALPAIACGWVAPLNDIVNISVCASVSEGASVAYSKAAALFTITTGVLVLSMLNFVFPKLTKINAQDDGDAFARTLGNCLNSLFYFLIPLGAGLFLLSYDLCACVFKTGNFDGAAVSQTGAALRLFSLQTVGFGLTSVLSRAFYARKNVMTPLLAGAGGFLINILLANLLKNRIGASGAPIALGVSVTVTGVFMLVSCLREKIALFGENAVKDYAGIISASLIMSLAAALFPRLGGDGRLVVFVNLCCITVVSGGIYFALTFFLNVTESKKTAAFIKGLLNAHKKKEMDSK